METAFDIIIPSICRLLSGLLFNEETLTANVITAKMIHKFHKNRTFGVVTRTRILKPFDF